MKKGTQAVREAARLAVTKEVKASLLDPRQAITRSHVDTLRLAGTPRADVVALVAELGGQPLAQIIAADLDSYGDWA